MNKLLPLFLLLLVSCATRAPYQKQGVNGILRVGYSETKITNNSYRVLYLDTDPNVAYQRFMRRAAELTQESGFKFFSIKDGSAGKENMVMKVTYMDVSNNQYEGTVIFDKAKTDSNYDASEVLDAQKEVIAKENADAQKRKERLDKEMKNAKGSI